MIRGGRRFQKLVSFFTVAALLGIKAISLAGTPLTTFRVASGLSRPLYVTFAPGDPTRIYVVEQTRKIRVIRNGELLAAPFLDVTALASYNGSERGLLGMAFHPEFADNRFFYINYTDTSGDTVIARYTATSSDVADASTALIVLRFDQPFPNHNGGWLSFGPDGYLYVASGDGGSQFDPDGNGQSKDTYLRKILRLDVDGEDFPDDADRNYAIPPDNPFVEAAGFDEIWAYGLRNPWRCAFDSQTGDLYIADVGQDSYEEINFQPANSSGGENYGWRCMEGLACTFLGGCVCNSAGLTMPFHTYPHEDGEVFHCSITGGEVYRGMAIADLSGTYFFADICSQKIWSFRNGPLKTDFQDRTSEIAPCHGQLPTMTLRDISSFGLDFHGETYICDLYGGEVYKIAPDVPVRIVNGMPPDGAIDARSPILSESVEYSMWNNVTLTFDQPTGCLSKTHFTVSKDGGDEPAPTILTATTVTANPYLMAIALSSGIEVESWVEITHTASSTSLRLGALPGDVDGSGVTSPIDILHLIDKLTGKTSLSGIWTFDLDHSGALATNDVTRLLALLRGNGFARAYLGASLP